MKIIVIARTRNEEKNIAKFCNYYSWADRILIADGGSKDRTVPIARTFSNVDIRPFRKRVRKEGKKEWRNPHGLHINFLIRWAVKRKADWIIFDDVDCFPTLHLQQDFRDVLLTTSRNCVFLNRVYMYGDNEYLRDATLPNRKGGWEKSTSLYAWKPGVVSASEDDPWVHDMILRDADILHLSPPYGALHDFYPSDGSRMNKVKFYRNSGEQPKCNDPLVLYKDKQPVEEWMRCE